MTGTGDLLDWLTGTEEVSLLEVPCKDPLCPDKLVDEEIVVVPVERAVEVVPRRVLLIAGLLEDDAAVYGKRVDNGRRGIKEAHALAAHGAGDGVKELS